MTARILVVDDLLVNVKLLEARLSAEYYDVLTAHSGQEALDICARERVDIVLLDVMMPGLDGFETCRRLKTDPATQHIPVIMVTALDQAADRVRCLEFGADDFLTKPVDDLALITRVRNLTRLKMLNDEMLMRASTRRSMGLVDQVALEAALQQSRGRIIVVDDHQRSASRLHEVLSVQHEVSVEAHADTANAKITEDRFDLAIVSMSLTGSDGMRLCSQLRTRENTRHLPIIMLVEPQNEARLLRGLDLGVTDYLIRPIDRQELLARVHTQIKRKRYSDYLRKRLESCFELSIMDPLTQLHNRRYLDSHLNTLVNEAKTNSRPLSVLMVDVDHFKAVNDTYGHDAGDVILRECGARLRQNTRGVDLAARVGGEEFVIVMPDTDRLRAAVIGERLRASIAEQPFRVNDDITLRITASVGLGSLDEADDTPETLLKRADKALYAAKRHGRNRVSADAA
ncbi:MAG: PleD family two-component system response regulator [Hyphomicrobiaceae bacterium]|jgi:two-component system, cell cycle response regulator|nr:PleD family two-component system response regulator [Hyphomicrobiaceae bacterium]